MILPKYWQFDTDRKILLIIIVFYFYGCFPDRPKHNDSDKCVDSPSKANTVFLVNT